MKNYKVLIETKTTINGADRSTFYKDSKAIFTVVKKPETKPDFISNSGSQYWYTDKGVIRYSDHWLTVASCFWYIKDHYTSTIECAGFCKWEDFKRTIWVEKEEIVHNKRYTKEGIWLNPFFHIIKFIGEIK